MNGFEFYSGLQYRVKAQARIIQEFESGERYLKLEEKHEAAIRERDGSSGGWKRNLRKQDRRSCM